MTIGYNPRREATGGGGRRAQGVAADAGGRGPLAFERGRGRALGGGGKVRRLRRGKAGGNCCIADGSTGLKAVDTSISEMVHSLSQL